LDFSSDRGEDYQPLAGKTIGIYFTKPSTRTRTSFTVGALKLGGHVVAYGPNDLQLVTGETIEDTAQILSCYLDALVIRTNETFSDIEAWASQAKVGIINAMTANEHPSQAIADLSTIKEAFSRLDNVHILYMGEGNNTAAALALGVAHIPGMRITLVTPDGYGVDDSILHRAHSIAARHDVRIEHHHSMAKLPKKVDVVYTTRWCTMGEPHSDPHWREKFATYSVTSAVMAQVSKSRTIFLHDLPAVRGEDVSAEVLEGSQSLVWRQAHYKMFSAMAILEWCLEGSNEPLANSVSARAAVYDRDTHRSE
jgi:ornithine carbamoyltransferase